MIEQRKLRVATVSLAGCFGCHMSFLDIDEHLFELLERIEADLRAVVPRCSVLTHLEPQEDPCAWEDIDLDRPATPGAAATPS